MWADTAIDTLPKDKELTRDDLFRALQNEKQDLNESTFRWTLYNLQKEEKLFKTGYDSYTIARKNALPVYHPIYSNNAESVISFLTDKFPDLQFVVFESVLLNEFLNHQIAQNTVYVEIEKDLSSYIFDTLQENISERILYKPGKKDFDTYWTKDCIVVLDMISQAPLSSAQPHDITIEHMLVDIIAEKAIAATFSPSELPSLFSNVKRSYQINEHRMLRYAGRRGKTSQIKGYMEETD